MKTIANILALLITAIHLFRFNLPTYFNEISVFDALNALAWILVIVFIIFFNTKTKLAYSLFIFNGIGALNQLTDELFFDPTRRGTSDYVILGTGILISLWYYIYGNQTTSQNEWNQTKSNPKDHGG